MSARDPDEEAPSDSLDPEDQADVDDRSAPSPLVVHTVIRERGEEELARTARSLFYSALAAGVGICASLLGVATIGAALPDIAWAPLVTSLGYTLGFVIVVLGNLQLFTESTVTAVLPVIARPTGANFARLLRLWGIVLAGNLLGTLVVAAMIAHAWIVTPETRDAAIAFSAHLLERDFAHTLAAGIPAGFLIASLAWILPHERAGGFWIVVAITYLVALGDFAHVVVGSAEAWLLLLTERATIGWTLGGFVLPALLGNIIGGSGLFALLAHAQVVDEIDD